MWNLHQESHWCENVANVIGRNRPLRLDHQKWSAGFTKTVPMRRQSKSTKLCPWVGFGILDPWIIQSRPFLVWSWTSLCWLVSPKWLKMKNDQFKIHVLASNRWFSLHQSLSLPRGRRKRKVTKTLSTEALSPWEFHPRVSSCVNVWVYFMAVSEGPPGNPASTPSAACSACFALPMVSLSTWRR